MHEERVRERGALEDGIINYILTQQKRGQVSGTLHNK